MDAILRQAEKVLELIAKSGRPGEWVQNHLIGSGALSDLLAVDDLAGMNRDGRRLFLGLSMLNLPLLEEIGTVTIPATTKPFVAREKFVVNLGEGAPVKISFLGGNFQDWFLGKTENSMEAIMLRYAKLTKPSPDSPILTELGEKAKTTLSQIYALMAGQPNGEEGVLLTNGWANIFYVDGRAVRVNWYGHGWLVHAYLVTDPGRWHDEYRVFSRNS